MGERKPAIRKATPSDSAGILKCLRAAFDPHRNAYTPEAFADTVLTPETLQHRLATVRLFVAVTDAGEIVGTIGCHVVNPIVDPMVHSTDVHSTEGHIRGMAVLPAWQGSCVASQLLKSAESELHDRGCLRITLNTTEPLLKAMRFYEKNGFRQSGIVKDFFGMPLLKYVKTLTD
jgi:GNAT superfamily N-acetyltransferase